MATGGDGDREQSLENRPLKMVSSSSLPLVEVVCEAEFCISCSSVSKGSYSISREFPREIIMEVFSESDSDLIGSSKFKESVSMLTLKEPLSKIKLAFFEELSLSELFSLLLEDPGEFEPPRSLALLKDSSFDKEDETFSSEDVVSAISLN